MNLLYRYFTVKNKIKSEIEKELGDLSIKRAIQDYHAKRRPRACGLTVHTGVGCKAACLYCYIYDMGFSTKTLKYPLTVKELIYSLTINPYVLPGKVGTLFALGSVTEPFQEETKDFSLRLISDINRYLGNPTQISTKWHLSKEDIRRLKLSDPNLSILYTFITYRYHDKLEPNAPSIEDRMETIKGLVKAGLNISIFIRPIIPGITDVEARDILKVIVEAGVKSVVLGTLRVTKRIYRRLAIFPNVLRELNSRVNTSKLSSRQVNIRGRDLKLKISRIAKEYGLKVYPSACSANIDHHKLGCKMCRYGPCGNIKNIPTPSESDIQDFIRELGVKGMVNVDIDEHIKITIPCTQDRAITNVIKYVVSYAYMTKVNIHFR